jgi:2-polyprenyl-6-methoxyphenol hydroxylase-like FAD-dependent oxidoreductase
VDRQAIWPDSPSGLAVLIVGAGPAGLTLAIGLGQLGVTCEVVDAKPAPSRGPGAFRCTARTMEIFRRLGIAGRLRAAGLPAEAPLDVLICAGSVSRPLVRRWRPPVASILATGREINDGTMPLEPELILSQYTLEPLLREIAEATPKVTVRFGTELVDFADTGGAVTAMLRSGTRLRPVRAGYLAGCDGEDSVVRQMLGIELRGETREPVRQALFYCPELYERLPAGRGIIYHIVGDHPCTLIVQDDAQHFVLHAPAGGPPPTALLAALLASVTDQALDYKVLSEAKWAQHMMLADRYGSDRVFLVGDAAHPTGSATGVGLGTAIADAADLAWKLAATVRGWGGAALLQSYTSERRPVAAQAITASAAAESLAADLPLAEFGYHYTGSPVIAPAEGSGPDQAGRYTPTTWPGARLPHIWLDDGTALHDRLGPGFTLLSLPETSDTGGVDYAASADYAAGLTAAFRRLGAPLAALEATSAAAQAVYAGHRLILVRPDLHVAWRSGDSQPDPDFLARLVTGHG